MAPQKIWRLQAADEELVRHLSDTLKIHPVLCRLLVLRGICDFESARSFFRPSLSRLHDPFMMKGMEKAVLRILQAMRQGEKIMIYGDYDVDGTTAVAVVFSFLKNNFQDAGLSFYVPHRYKEGYGISIEGIEKAISYGTTLLITLDCGIKSTDKIAYANSKGIDVIVCDHHTPDHDNLPDAYVILNPKQNDCSYPYKELSGCGIGYKLVCALAIRAGLPPGCTEPYLDLVATSIAADIVPMDGENRILAYYGLQQANHKPCLALQTIKEISGINRPFTVSDLVFIVAPRINAAGRMDDARKAIEFFIEKDPDKSKQLALLLHADNYDRREVDKTMTEEALDILLHEEELYSRKSTVLFRPHWHKGVVGIVASRLIEHYYRPTIVLTESNGKITGSARSVQGFNIYEAIHQCGDLLENYGGHYFAAGMTLGKENLDAFTKKFEEVVSGSIQKNSMTPEIEVDAALDFKDITPGFYNIIKQFEPFGPANMRPVFITKGVHNYSGYCRVVKDAHIRFVIAQGKDNSIISGIGFNMADKLPLVNSGAPFDIVYTIDENEWKGNKSVQIKVIDLVPSG